MYVNIQGLHTAKTIVAHFRKCPDPLCCSELDEKIDSTLESICASDWLA